MDRIAPIEPGWYRYRLRSTMQAPDGTRTPHEDVSILRFVLLDGELIAHQWRPHFDWCRPAATDYWLNVAGVTYEWLGPLGADEPPPPGRDGDYTNPPDPAVDASGPAWLARHGAWRSERERQWRAAMPLPAPPKE